MREIWLTDWGGRMATKISGKRQRRRFRKTKSGHRNSINDYTCDRHVNSTEGQRSSIIIIDIIKLLM
jgi:hypothetical protein